ncbi:DMT family transporter [Gymnodinialimonas sp. 2305UL16-5]|uniref:DMT family transporter n=1 Tax=Gymnodinialimonas mytili TaxID=3126503 RepID=UPI0030A725D3
MTPNTQGAFWMTVSMASFAANDAVVKLITEEIPLFQFVFIRGLITTALMAATAMAFGGLSLRIPRGDRGKVAWRTIFEIAAMVAFLTALVNMQLANATAILAALPLSIALGAALIFGEPIGWRRLTAILVGAVGVLMIIQPGTDGFNAYALIALLAVLFVTGRDLATRAFSSSVPSMGVAVITAFVVALAGGILSIWETWAAFSPRSLFLLALASVLIIGGYVCSILAMRVGEVAAVAPFRYTSLVCALLLGFVVFGEWPNELAFAGAGIVMATGLYTILREHRLARRGGQEI